MGFLHSLDQLCLEVLQLKEKQERYTSSLYWKESNPPRFFYKKASTEFDIIFNLVIVALSTILTPG